MNIELIEQLIDTKEFSRICEDAERGNRDAARFINKFMNECARLPAPMIIKLSNFFFLNIFSAARKSEL